MDGFHLINKSKQAPHCEYRRKHLQKGSFRRLQENVCGPAVPLSLSLLFHFQSDWDINGKLNRHAQNSFYQFTKLSIDIQCFPTKLVVVVPYGTESYRRERRERKTKLAKWNELRVSEGSSINITATALWYGGHITTQKSDCPPESVPKSNSLI